MIRLLKIFGQLRRQQPVLFPLLFVAYTLLLPAGIVLTIVGPHAVGLGLLILGAAIWFVGDIVLAVLRARRPSRNDRRA